jgi:hypothetical protein
MEPQRDTHRVQYPGIRWVDGLSVSIVTTPYNIPKALVRAIFGFLLPIKHNILQKHYTSTLISFQQQQITT